MSGPLLPWAHDREHVRRLHHAHADHIESQYRGMLALPGNPAGVVMRTFGTVRTFIATGERLENRAIFTGGESDETVRQVLQHFVDHRANCVLEVNPANYYANPPATWEKRLLRQLTSLGCAIHDFRCVWYRAADERDEEPPPPARHRIESFGPDRVTDYVAAARLVQPAEQWTAEFVAARSQPGWLNYVAYDAGGGPCAVGSLFVRAPTAYLAWWYTHPDHRGVGLQQAGIRRRVRDAFDLGCDVAFTVTDFNFTSPANLQRCGFRLAYNYLLLRREPVPLP